MLIEKENEEEIVTEEGTPEPVLETIIEPAIPEAIAQSVEVQISHKEAYLKHLRSCTQTTSVLSEIEEYEEAIRELKRRS